jgi:hypothetical protein
VLFVGGGDVDVPAPVEGVEFWGPEVGGVVCVWWWGPVVVGGQCVNSEDFELGAMLFRHQGVTSMGRCSLLTRQALS